MRNKLEFSPLPMSLKYLNFSWNTPLLVLHLLYSSLSPPTKKNAIKVIVRICKWPHNLIIIPWETIEIIRFAICFIITRYLSVTPNKAYSTITLWKRASSCSSAARFLKAGSACNIRPSYKLYTFWGHHCICHSQFDITLSSTVLIVEYCRFYRQRSSS